MKKTQSKPFLGGLVGFINAETLVPLVPIIILMFVVLTISSLIIWPYLFMMKDETTSMGVMSKQVLISGLIGFGVTAVMNMLLAAFSEKGYSAEGSITFCTWLCPIVIWIAMGVRGIRPMGVDAGGISTMLNIIVIGIIGLILSIIPAGIAILLGWVTRIICGVISRRL